MKIDESNYNIFYRISNKFKNMDVNIIWEDNEDIKGYIPVEEMFNIIQDLENEYSLLEEKYQDLLAKIKERLQKKEEHEFMLQMSDTWDNEDRLASDLINQEIQSLKSFIENEN